LNRPRIRAVTFDMDGLMFNTEDLYDEVTTIVLSRRGKQYTLEHKLSMMGLPGPKAFEVLSTRLMLNDAYEIFQSEMDAVFADILSAKIQKMPGLDELLQILEEKQIPKAVATSSHRQFAETALGIFDLIGRFEFILCGEDVLHGKPHPEIYLTSAQRLRVAVNEMLAFEDSLHGSRAASASGAYTVAIPTSHSRGLDFSHAHLIADSLADPRVRGLFE
jgi:HAD superfamily hydrolase (TIGR01509 family)